MESEPTIVIVTPLAINKFRDADQQASLRKIPFFDDLAGLIVKL